MSIQEKTKLPLNALSTLGAIDGDIIQFNGTDWEKAQIQSGRISNCITEIPQDIKLELNNGTLTLKEGSKVYDGNSNSFSITSDITKSGLAGGDVQQLLLLKIDGTTLISVGVTDTTFAYNSSTGYVHSNTDGDYYLPIALTSHNTGTGEYTSIDQVFNGFGYIGSTVFALPCVKGLIPNGRNEDGSLKNIEFETKKVFVKTYAQDYTSTGILGFNPSLEISFSISGGVEYNESQNINFDVDGNTNWNRLFVGNITYTNGKITSLTPKTTFHALDWNDIETVVGWMMPDYSAGVSKSKDVEYTAEVSGWITLSVTNGTQNPATLTIDGVTAIYNPREGDHMNTYSPVFVGKGQKYKLTGSFTVGAFVFYPCKGVN